MSTRASRASASSSAAMSQMHTPLDRGDVVMTPQSHPPQSMFGAPVAGRSKESENQDVSEKYRKLKRKYFELEEVRHCIPLSCSASSSTRFVIGAQSSKLAVGPTAIAWMTWQLGAETQRSDVAAEEFRRTERKMESGKSVRRSCSCSCSPSPVPGGRGFAMCWRYQCCLGVVAR